VTSVAVGPSGSARWGLLGERRFRLLWIGETTSSFGSSVSAVALPLVALSVVHAGVFAVSLLSAAAWLPWLAIGLPAGAVVDRLRRRRIMIVADLVSALAFTSVPVADVFGWLSTPQLLVVALLAGGASVFFTAAYRAFIPALVGSEDLLEANAKLQGSEQVTHIGGPGVAGAIAQVAGAVGGVIVDAVSFVVSAGCLLRVDAAETKRTVARRPMRREIAEGLGLVWREPLLRTNAIFGCFSNFVLIGYQALTVVFLVRVVGLSSGATGLLLALASVGGVVGALAARRVAIRFGSARGVLMCKCLVMPFGLLLPLTHRGPRLTFFVVGSVVVIGGIVAGNIIWQGWVQTYYPAELLGRLSTSVQVVNYGAMPLGAIAAGAMASTIGIRLTVAILMAGLMLSSLVLLLGPLRTIRDLPSVRRDA
jgi:MFS family permease